MTDAWSDISKITEDGWKDLSSYHVPDSPSEDQCPQRAELSLPRILEIKTSEIHPDVSRTFFFSFLLKYMMNLVKVFYFY